MRTVQLGSMALGVNNRVKPTALERTLPNRTKATYLHAGDNVDIDEMGKVRRRRGTTTVLEGDAHSIWADEEGAFAVIDGSLKALSRNGEGLLGITVRTPMPSLPLSYSRGADGDVYWTNGAQLRRVVAGATDRPAATPPLSSIPAIGLIGGALAAGKYLVAMTVVDADGESPATPVVQVDVPENGGIRIVSPDAVAVYMSAPDGDILTLQVAGATGTIDVLTYNESGRRCATLNTAVMPSGSIVRHYNGCMLVAAGPVLYVSLPYRYGLFDPSKGYIPLPADITMVEPTTNGVYIAADKTYWIADLLAQDQLLERLPYGAIPGTSGRSPDDLSAFWQSPRGLVVGDENGAVKAVQEDALAFSAAASGASLYRERDGAVHIVSSRAGAQPNTAAASTWMEAEIVRKGTTL